MSNNRCTNSIIHFPPLRNTLHMHMWHLNIFSTCEIWRTGRHIGFVATNRNKHNTKYCWKISILWTGHIKQNFSFIGRYLVRTVVCNQKHFQKSFKTIKLYGHKSIRVNPISCQWHDFLCSQWLLLSFHHKTKKPRRRHKLLKWCKTRIHRL